MNLKQPIFILSLMMFVANSNSMAQTNTTEGKTFWLTFMENLGGSNGCSDNSVPVLKVIISSKTVASGTISNPITNKNYYFSIGTGGGLDTVFIPVSQGYSYFAESLTSNKFGLLVQSSHPVAVSAQNIKLFSGDATTVLPYDALDDEYIVVSQAGDLYGNNACFRSTFVIVATEDSTTIDIVPSCNTSGGKTAGVGFSIVLNRGETYLLKASTNKLDLSGTTIKAKNCKRIAVFSGANRASITFGTCTPSYDHLYEQLIPVKFWSTKYLITPTIYSKNNNRKAELIKVVAALNSTTVRVNGRTKILSTSGKTDTFYITSDAVILSTKPIAVCQFSISEDCDKIFGGTNADPMMIMANPVQNFANDIAFGVDIDTSKYNTFINLITLTKYIDSLSLDGKTIGYNWTKFKKDSLYSYIQLDSLKQGKHQLKSNYGFSAFLYDYGDLGGMGVNTGFNYKSTIEVSINDHTLNEDNVSNNIIDTCANSVITFSAAPINQSYSSWKWLFRDVNSTTEKTTNPASYKYKNGGVFDITIIGIKNLYGVCNGQTTSYDSLKFNVHIFEKSNLKFLKSKPKVCKDSILTISVNDFDKLKSSKFFWTFNGTDTVLNDTMITRTVKSQNIFEFNYIDSNTCFFKDTIEVSGLNNPTFNLATPIYKCSNDTVKIETKDHIYNDLYTYKWYINNILENTTDSFIEYQDTIDAKIKLIISNQGICFYSDTSYIKILPKPTFNIIGLSSYTTKDTINLVTDKSFASYRWFNDTLTRNNKFPATNLGQPGSYWAWCIVKDFNGCMGVDSLEINLSKSSTIEFTKDNPFRFYPNPVNTILHIDNTEQGILDIYTIEGKHVLQFNMDKELNIIDVSSLNKGMYILRLHGQNSIFIKG